MPSLVKRNSYQGDGRGPKERGAEERRSETGSVGRGQGGSNASVRSNRLLGGANLNRPTLTPRSDDFHHDLTVGPVLVHHGVRLMEPLERETRSELERELTGLHERDVFLKLRACDIGRLTAI